VASQELQLGDATGPVLAVGQDRAARPRVSGGGRLEDRPVALGGSVGAARDLDDPGPMRRPPYDRPAVVEGVDALLDVGDEQVGQLAGREPPAPVAVKKNSKKHIKKK
jgi:hypothetical protein